jgi:hypothetical protein
MRAIDSPHKITPIGAIFRKINFRVPKNKKSQFFGPLCIINAFNKYDPIFLLSRLFTDCVYALIESARQRKSFVVVFKGNLLVQCKSWFAFFKFF